MVILKTKNVENWLFFYIMKANFNWIEMSLFSFGIETQNSNNSLLRNNKKRENYAEMDKIS